MKTKLEKAKEYLSEIGVVTTIKSGASLNIMSGDTVFKLHEDEVDFYAEEYDDMNPLFTIKDPKGYSIKPDGGGWRTLEDAEKYFYKWLAGIMAPQSQYSMGLRGTLALEYPDMYCLMHTCIGHDELGCKTELNVADKHLQFPIAYLSIEEARKEIADLLCEMYLQVSKGERTWEDRYTEDDYYVAQLHASPEEWGVFDMYTLDGNPIIRYNCLTDSYTTLEL